MKMWVWEEDYPPKYKDNFLKIAQTKPYPALSCHALPSPPYYSGLLGCALTYESSLSLSLSTLSLSTAPPPTQVGHLLRLPLSLTRSTETNYLCYPTTSLVSHQIYISMAGWSEVNQFAQTKPSSVLPSPVPNFYFTLTLLCHYIDITLSFLG